MRSGLSSSSRTWLTVAFVLVAELAVSTSALLLNHGSTSRIFMSACEMPFEAAIAAANKHQSEYLVELEDTLTDVLAKVAADERDAFIRDKRRLRNEQRLKRQQAVEERRLAERLAAEEASIAAAAAAERATTPLGEKVVDSAFQLIGNAISTAMNASLNAINPRLAEAEARLVAEVAAAAEVEAEAVAERDAALEAEAKRQRRRMKRTAPAADELLERFVHGFGHGQALGEGAAVRNNAAVGQSVSMTDESTQERSKLASSWPFSTK